MSILSFPNSLALVDLQDGRLDVVEIGPLVGLLLPAQLHEVLQAGVHEILGGGLRAEQRLLAGPHLLHDLCTGISFVILSFWSQKRFVKYH